MTDLFTFLKRLPLECWSTSSTLSLSPHPNTNHHLLLIAAQHDAGGTGERVTWRRKVCTTTTPPTVQRAIGETGFFLESSYGRSVLKSVTETISSDNIKLENRYSSLTLTVTGHNQIIRYSRSNPSEYFIEKILTLILWRHERHPVVVICPLRVSWGVPTSYLLSYTKLGKFALKSGGFSQ